MGSDDLRLCRRIDGVIVGVIDVTTRLSIGTIVDEAVKGYLLQSAFVKTGYIKQFE